MIALGVAHALAVQLALEAPGHASWCNTALPLASAPEPAAGTESDAFDAMALALPREATPVVARARELAGEEGLARSVSVLRHAIFDACLTGIAGDENAPAVDAAQAAAQAAALMNDPRFAGVRKGDGAIDRLLHQVYMFFISLIESEGMQKYAGGSRVVFLSLIALGAIALTISTLRRRRLESQQASASSSEGGARAEAQRKEAYAELRAQADALLARGDARASLRVADAALLARVGELDERTHAHAGAKARERAVTEARTHREIIARLPQGVGDVVREPFAQFDALFFGRERIAVDDARAFLASVDAAEARLRAPGAAPVAPSGVGA